MKRTAILIFCLFCLPLIFSLTKIQVTTERKAEESKPNLDLCPMCIQTMDQIINELLNIILNVGVIGSCQELCGFLTPYGQIVVVACNLICDYAGIEGFIWLIEHADLNPIWLCQEIKLCPIHDCKLDVCAKFTKDTVIQPNPGLINGPPVTFGYQFEVYEQTGTGEILLAIHTAPKSMPPLVDASELVSKGYEKGVYDVNAKIEFKDDPGAEFPIIFEPGQYQAHMHICEGLCGSKHAHTRELAEQWANFTMTK